MAYIKQTWEDRVVEKPMTYTMTTNEDGTVTLTPVPGTITNEGSKVNAERMNHIEQGIYDAAISGGSDVVFIGDTEPTNEQTKLWVEDDMLTSLGTEIESGSNENGFWIKFADGTMIQMFATHRTEGVSKNSYVSELINLPNAFIDNTYIISYNQSWNPSGWADIRDTVYNKTKTSFNIEMYNSNSNYDAGAINYYWIAIGRWK